MAVVYYTDKAIARVERVDIPAEAFAEVDRIKNAQDSAGTDHNLWDEFLSKFTFDVDNLLKINFSRTEVLQPIDIQNHWGEAVTLLASGARTSSGNGADVDVERFVMGELCIDVTGVSGDFASGEGLRVIVEGKDEVTGKYKVIYDSDESLGGKITKPVTDWFTITNLAFRILRVRWEISGTNPSFTFSVTMQGKA